MRIRDLKPDFWTDERVVELSDAAKLLYQGLWCLADRDGILEHQPLTIGFKVRPWDPKKVPSLIAELVAAKMVVAYSVAGKAYLGIPTFSEHQRFHPNEKPRGLPSWVADAIEVTNGDHEATNGNQEEHLKVASKAGSSLPAGPSGPAGSSLVQQAPPAPTPEDLQRLWNETTAPPIPRCEGLGKTREAAAKAALRRRPLDEWRRVFERINASAYCRGEVNDWKADFDWATRAEGKKPEPAAKVLEGSFDRGTGPPRPSADPRPQQPQAQVFR